MLVQCPHSALPALGFWLNSLPRFHSPAELQRVGVVSSLWTGPVSFLGAHLLVSALLKATPISSTFSQHIHSQIDALSKQRFPIWSYELESDLVIFQEMGNRCLMQTTAWDTTWWKELVNRHSVEHAVVVLFYGAHNLPHALNEKDAALMVQHTHHCLDVFMDACVRQAFTMLLMGTTHQHGAQTVVHLLNLLAGQLPSPLIVPPETFYHTWTRGVTMKNPAASRQFTAWLLRHSSEQMRYKGFVWLADHSQPDGVHTAYWESISDHAFDGAVCVEPWGLPGCNQPLLTHLQTIDEVDNDMGDRVVQSFIQKQHLLDGLNPLLSADGEDGDGGQGSGRRKM